MKKLLKKVSKKSILIASILIILLGIPVLAYLFIIEQTEDTVAWYSGSWMYRRKVDLACAGCPRTNAQYLITLDTAALISQGKMRSDCGDLRIVDSNDSTTLSYWIEGGCNTSTTQIWVLIPSMNNNPYPIYAYYGNPSATTTEESWSGNFILFSAASCPTGWTRNTDFDNLFVYGGSSYGSTGGVSGSHNHGGAFTVATGGTASTGGVSGDTEPNCANLPSATHTISATRGTADSTPPFINILLCNRTKLTSIDNLTFISDSSTPSGWSRLTSLDNRFPSGNSTFGTTGGTSTHTHSVTISSVGQSAQFCEGISEPNPNMRTVARATHNHTASLSSNVAISNLPPHRIMLYVTAPSNTNTLSHSIISATNVVPPLGWTRHSSFDNIFIMGGSTVNNTTQGSATHSHSTSFTTGGPSATINWNAGSMAMAGSTHTHTATHNSSSISLLPPFRTIIYIMRNPSEGFTINAEEVMNTQPTAPTSLLTEGQTNPSRVADLTPEFSAIFNDPDTGDTGVFYQIQVNTASNFEGTSMWDSGKTSMSSTANGARITDVSYAGTTLSTNGITYFWRIKLWDNIDGESPWSATAAFTMNTTPSVPTALLTESSINPIKVYDTTPEFSAIFNDPNTGDTGTHYQIQVSTVLNFSSTVWNSNQTSISPIPNGSRSTDISYGGTTLALDGTLYYWRIKFWDNSGTESDWSSTATFRMSANPFAPTNLKVDGRINPIVIDSTTPTFYATHTDINEDGAIFFELHVNSNVSFTGTVKWNTGKTNINLLAHGQEFIVTYGGTQLQRDGTTYYWRIRFWDVDNNMSPWSATASFVDLFKYTRINGVGMEGLQIN